MRAAIYARFSTELQKDASIEDQFRVCRRVADIQGFDVVATFEDRGISGGTSERPGYQALLAAVRSGSVAIVIAEDVSRLWRNRSEFGQRSAELEDLGCHLLTAVGDDTRREGWGLLLGIKSAIAEHARRETSYRTRRGLEGRALAGQSTGGRVYGYRGAQIAPEEARWVLGIYEQAAAGLSLSRIASWLAAQAVPSPSGAETWARGTLARILSNRRYLGEVTWGARLMAGGARDSKRKHRVVRPEGPLVNRQDDKLQIVKTEMFDKVKLLRRNTKELS
jgi:site-specific DNA recombinase